MNKRDLKDIIEELERIMDIRRKDDMLQRIGRLYTELKSKYYERRK